MNAIFEFLPLVLFLIVSKLADIYWATATLIGSSALHLMYFKVKGQLIPKKTWMLFGMISVFGGLTIFFQNDAFIKWKVTIINLLFAIILIVGNYLFKKNFIKELMSEALTLPENVWNKMNLSWAGFFTFCALLNLYVAYNFEQATWVNFKVFGLLGLTFVFAILTILVVQKYLPEEQEENNQESEKIK